MATKQVLREQRLEQVRGWVRSGLPCAAFAARVGVNPATLAWWKWKFQSEGVLVATKQSREHNGQKGEKPGPAFVEVLPAFGPELARPRIELELGDATLRVPDDFDDGTLGRLLALLRSTR